MIKNKFDAIVPCFNEEGRVGNVLEVLSTSKYIDQVIFVDDGSTDGSLNEAGKIKGIKIIELKENVGKSGAVKKGLSEVKTSAVFLFDADISGLSENHIKKIYFSYLKNPESMVVGLRQKNSLPLLHWMRKNIFPLIAGERILATENLIQILKNFNVSEYGLEPYMNYYFNVNRKPIVKILLSGVNDLPKWKKKSYGFKPFFEESVNIFSKYLQIYSQEIPKNIYNSLSSFILPLKITKQEEKNFYSVIFPQHQTTINRVKINYVKAGSGPILVFVHGWANNWVSWIPLADYLCKNYTVYLIDLPGFGDSDDLPHYSIETVSEYLKGFIERLPEKPKALVGLSMGSLVVAQVGKIDEKISENLILISPVIKNKSLSDLVSTTLESSLKIMDHFSLSEMFLKKIIETRIAAYSMSKYMNMYKFNKFLVDEYGMIGKKKMRKEAFVQMGYSGASYDLKEVLFHHKMPVLLIYGREDKISSPQNVRKSLLKMNDKIKLKVIPFAGHVVPLEEPEKVATSIRDYLEVMQ